jgi:hypothetical protein
VPGGAGARSRHQHPRPRGPAWVEAAAGRPAGRADLACVGAVAQARQRLCEGQPSAGAWGTVAATRERSGSMPQREARVHAGSREHGVRGGANAVCAPTVAR